MRVIGVGFGRTGTASMKLALEQLGFGPCHHMIEVLRSTERRRLWGRVLAGEPVDWPSTAYWKELVDAYPDAKVLLTVRDPDKWYDSMAATILPQIRGTEPMALRLLMRAVSAIRPDVRDLFAGLRTKVGDGTFDGRGDREHLTEVFREHTKQVQEYVSADRLLTYEVGDGWEPLCEFLDVPVPDHPFPRVNESADALRRFRQLLLRMLGRPAIKATVVAIAATALVVRARRRKRVSTN